MLLDRKNHKRKRDTIELNLSGYSDVMFLIADIVKVCILALHADDNSIPGIPEPATNISGVLGIILDLVPYEEIDLLDLIREEVLNPTLPKEDINEEDLVDVFLTIPKQLLEQNDTIKN